MSLLAAGEPLHTRVLTVEVRSAEGGRLALRGEVIDLRKRGLVPVPGSLQLPGVIHRMEIDARIDPAERRIERLEGRQPVVAFEPSETTGGESCRDPVAALASLRGARLDGDFLKRLSEVYGGPRGCTHLLTLARLAASAGVRALDAERALGAPRREGERVFRRTLLLDGFEREEGVLQIAIQLGDVHVRPPPTGSADSLDRLSSQTEVRVSATLRISDSGLLELRAEERTRARGDLAAPFSDRSGELRELAGRPLMAGFGPEVLRRFGAEPRSAPLLDALLNLAPGYVQCVAAVTDLFLPGGRGPAALGARPDSCFMWRRGGALQRAMDGRSPRASD